MIASLFLFPPGLLSPFSHISARPSPQWGSGSSCSFDAPLSLDEVEAADHNYDFNRAEECSKQNGRIRQDDRADAETDKRYDGAKVIGCLAVQKQESANDQISRSKDDDHGDERGIQWRKTQSGHVDDSGQAQETGSKISDPIHVSPFFD
jgi:hypothetical protein